MPARVHVAIATVGDRVMDTILVLRTGIFTMIGVSAIGGLVLAVVVSIIEMMTDEETSLRMWKVVLPFVGGALFVWVIAILCDSLIYSIIDSGG